MDRLVALDCVAEGFWGVNWGESPFFVSMPFDAITISDGNCCDATDENPSARLAGDLMCCGVSMLGLLGCQDCSKPN